MGKRDWFNAAINNDISFIMTNIHKYSQKLDTSSCSPHQKGISALFLAIINGNSQIVDFLLDYEINITSTHMFTVSAPNFYDIILYPGSTALHVAFAAQDYTLGASLLDRVTQPDSQGDPPVALAPICRPCPSLEQLFDNVNFINQLKKCPTFLHNCALFGRFILIRKIVEKIVSGDHELALFVKNQMEHKVDGMNVYDLAICQIDEGKTGCSKADKVTLIDALKELEDVLQ
ncbi:Ankyrin repeat-containing protein [Spironucleus salmonicida]|uniref:Ankyrin repeat-containing protein n=1 Tax=Spironucleus salmonicida TaxID=348837 RepID=V6LE09_9EUKA|nr:Ankyrin repeat-containing protein [Spironucleus salmonicida]|eukprot:EST42702.1 Ankyrin repeat-containing protein [Spironucleus salmonicida]